MKTVIKTLVVLAVAGLLAVPAFVYSGLFNVAATWEDPAPVAWALHGTYRNSVEARVGDIEVPADLDSQARVIQGARNYLAMCSGCHTAPGLAATPVAQGLNPEPPELSHIIPHRTPAEAFWVIKNGVRMTGMPAFGPTHKDEELWALVAFVNRMSDASPEMYQDVIAQAKRNAPADDGHGHRHGNEPADAAKDNHGNAADASDAHAQTASDAVSPSHHNTQKVPEKHGTTGHHTQEEEPAAIPSDGHSDHSH